MNYLKRLKAALEDHRLHKRQKQIENAYYQLGAALRDQGIAYRTTYVGIECSDPDHRHEIVVLIAFEDVEGFRNSYITIEVDTKGKFYRIVSRAGYSIETIDPDYIEYIVLAKDYEVFLKEWASAASLALLDVNTWRD